jgi:hypothetical protein
MLSEAEEAVDDLRKNDPLPLVTATPVNSEDDDCGGRPQPYRCEKERSVAIGDSYTGEQ